MLLYVFNGLAFLLLGLQLRSVLSDRRGARGRACALRARAVRARSRVLRLLWVYPGTYLPLLLSPHPRAARGLARPARGVPRRLGGICGDR